MPSLDGITVRIFCGKQPLEEYSTLVDPEDSSTISCWIPSRADQTFSIRYDFEEQTAVEMSCTFLCDGASMRRSTIPPKSKYFKQSGARSGDNIHTVMFSEIIQTDSQDAAENPVNPDLGMIEVRIFLVTPCSKPVHKVRASEAPRVNISESPIHESKKMLGSHRVRLGQAIPKPRLAGTDKYVRKKHLKVFKFHYRPISVLQAMGHAPIVPGRSENLRDGTSLENGDNISETDTDGEAQNIEAQMQLLQQRMDTIRMKKEKRLKNVPRKPKGLKQEERMITMPPRAKGEVIDLCLD